MFFVGIILTFIIILALELPAFIKQKSWRDLAVFLSIFAISVYLGIAQLINWPRPSPLKILLNLFG